MAPQASWPLGQEAPLSWHTPRLQNMFAAQALPQPPQLAESFDRSVQTGPVPPPHAAKGAGHERPPSPVEPDTRQVLLAGEQTNPGLQPAAQQAMPALPQVAAPPSEPLPLPPVVTVTLTLPMIAPTLAVTLATPGATPVTMPVGDTCATAVLFEAHVAVPVRFCAVPSAKVPVATN